MDNSKVKIVLNEISANSRRRFVVFVAGSVVIAFLLVVISMELYNSSGAAQLDLSRPGYVTVRSQANSSDDYSINYSATGAINQGSINEFKTLFNEQAQKVRIIDAFGGDPLSPDSLGIGE